MSEKRKRVVLSLHDKMNIITRVDSGALVRALAKEYKIGEQTVRDIVKNRSKIVSYVAWSDSYGASPGRKTLKRSPLSQLDDAVFEWFQEKRSEGTPISGPMLCEKAKWFHKDLAIKESFSASNGWLGNFKKRHGIRQLENYGDTTHSEFLRFVQMHNLVSEQIYGAHQARLFWKALPATATNQSLSEPKETLPILICANSTGTNKLKLVLVGKTKAPQTEIPCVYYQEASVTEDIFKDWFLQTFVPTVRKHLRKKNLPEKAVLLLNSTLFTHQPENYPTSEDGQIFVHNLPLTQPIGQGAFEYLKRLYRNRFLNFLLEENAGDLKKTLKKWTLQEAMRASAEVWDQISEATLKSSWEQIIGNASETKIKNEEEFLEEMLDTARRIPEFRDIDTYKLWEWMSVDKRVEGCEKIKHTSVVPRPSLASLADFPTLETEKEEIAEPVSYVKALEATKTLLTFLEQEGFDFQEVLHIRKIRSDIHKRKNENNEEHFE